MISGHIHFFNHTIRDNIVFITTGGGGAVLHETLSDGGFHHYTNIELNLTDGTLTVEAITQEKSKSSTEIKLIKNSSLFIIDLYDLQSEFNLRKGYSSFENQYNNKKAYGYYIGVEVSDLLNIIGGFTKEQILQIEASDGFKQNYSHEVVYPNESWIEIQGVMILAFSFNGTLFPEWTDGLRIVFMAPDAEYSNLDCEATSPPGEGYNYYPSAGFRWIKYVKILRILEK